MEESLKRIDIDHIPTLVAIAEEVRKTSAPCILRGHSEDLAVLVPLRRARRRGKKRTEADYEAFRAAAGAWEDFDVDAFLRDLRASRAISTRPVPEL